MRVEKIGVKTLCIMSLFVALNIVMAELLKIKIFPGLELSFGFIPVALCGMLYGVVPTVCVAVVADVIGALIFSGGEFFFGYTLTALLTGLFYGLFLHKQPLEKLRIVLAQLLVSLVCYAGLNTLWAYLLYHVPMESVYLRLAAQPILFPVYVMVLMVMNNYRATFERAIRA